MGRTVTEVIDALPPARRAKIEARAAELIAEESSLQEIADKEAVATIYSHFCPRYVPFMRDGGKARTTPVTGLAGRRPKTCTQRDILPHGVMPAGRSAVRRRWQQKHLHRGTAGPANFTVPFTPHLCCCGSPGCGPIRRRLCSIAKMWL